MRILHLLNWNLKDIENELENIYYQGFDGIQINPMQPLKSDDISTWWLSYQPCGFRIGNQYGSKEDLISLCKKASLYNITIIADVICNHVAGANDGSLNPNPLVDPIIRDNPYFFKEQRNINNWDNRFEVIHYCMGLPGLNVWNYDLQDIIIDFLNELIDCGVNGFRFDAAKNIALPCEKCDFWPRVISSLKKYGLFLYGEVIFEERFRIDDYANYIRVATNSGCSNKELAVKYVENHDSFLDFGYTKMMTSKDVSAFYDKLTDEYNNTLYYARPFDDEWKSDMVKHANTKGQKVLRKTY